MFNLLSQHVLYKLHKMIQCNYYFIDKNTIRQWYNLRCKGVDVSISYFISDEKKPGQDRLFSKRNLENGSS